MKRTNVTPAIGYLRQRLEAVHSAISTFERIAAEYLEEKAQSASVRPAEVAAFSIRSSPEASDGGGWSL
jgi:hypothetical protein